MLRRWIDNELRPLSRLLVSGMPPPGGSIQGEPDKAVATVLVAWVLDEDREGVKLGRLLDILGRGQRLPAARLAMVLTPGERPSRLDAQWEAWVRKQRRVVHMGLPLDPLTELQATLLLCPGESENSARSPA